MSGLEKLARFALSHADEAPLLVRIEILQEAARHVPENISAVAKSEAALLIELGRHQLQLELELNK